MRKRIYEIIEVSDGNDKLSSIYDIAMLSLIIISIIPLAFKEDNLLFSIIDKVCVGFFILDYLLRLVTADYKYGKKSVFSFIRYPFSFMALVDLVSILPSLTVLNNGFKLLRLMRIMRAFRVFRVFKAFRYSKKRPHYNEHIQTLEKTFDCCLHVSGSLCSDCRACHF